MQKTLHTGDLRPKTLFLYGFLLRHRTLIIEIIAALYILLFVYTAINKFLAIDDLKFVLKSYPLISPFSEIIAWGLPPLELIVALLLFFPYTKLIGLYSSLALMTLFTLYLGYMLLLTEKSPCTCGGMLQQLSWLQHVIFNISFIVLALMAIKLYKAANQKRGTSFS